MANRVYGSMHAVQPALVQAVVDRIATHTCATQLAPSDGAVLAFGKLCDGPIGRTSSSGGSGATNSKFVGHGAMLVALSARGCGGGYVCVTETVQVAVKVWPGSTTRRSWPARRAFVGVVIGS
jgi:hypothetical protein